MKLEIRSVIPAGRKATWDTVMDIPKASACIPGMKEITPDGEGRFRAILEARVGPMGMTLTGIITIVSQDEDAGEAEFIVEAGDKRVGGGVKTNMTMKVSAQSDNHTELEIMSDTTFMGRLGELGQPIIRRKARNTLEDFSKNLSKLLTSEVG